MSDLSERREQIGDHYGELRWTKRAEGMNCFEDLWSGCWLAFRRAETLQNMANRGIDRRQPNLTVDQVEELDVVCKECPLMPKVEADYETGVEMIKLFWEAILGRENGTG